MRNDIQAHTTTPSIAATGWIGQLIMLFAIASRCLMFYIAYSRAAMSSTRVSTHYSTYLSVWFEFFATFRLITSAFGFIFFAMLRIVMWYNSMAQFRAYW